MERVVNKDIKIMSLCLNDIESVGELCKECEDYFLLCNGTLHTRKDLEEIFTSRQWIIGLFLLKKKERGKGIGKLIHTALSKIVLKESGKSLRIGVIKENVNGLNFWKNLGYKKIKESEMKFENKLHTVYTMVLEL